jgi:hypothetical protein
MMDFHKSIAAAVLVAAGALLTPVAAQGAKDEGLQSATASFVSHSADGCIVTETSVFVSKSADRREQLNLHMLRVNECTEQGLARIEVARDLPAGSFKMKANMSMASLNATVMGEDQLSKKKSPITVRLTWKAQEAAVTSVSQDSQAGLGKFKRHDGQVQKSLRMSDATGTVTFRRATITLRGPESSWVEMIGPGLARSQ